MTAQDAFLESCAAFDSLMERLAAARANHFSADPDGLDWGDVGTVKQANATLAEVARFLNA